MPSDEVEVNRVRSASTVTPGGRSIMVNTSSTRRRVSSRMTE